MHATNYLPAEWARQDAVLLSWPHAMSDWRPTLAQAEAVFLEIARQVMAREKLIVTCYDEVHKVHVSSLLQRVGESSRASLHVVPSNDTWVRDYGPITVLEGGVPCLLAFRFNGWGRKFDSALDDRVAHKLHQLGAFGSTPLQAVDKVLEGGSIETDGAGTLLTTSSCLLSSQRNPTLNRQQIEAQLKELFGLERVIWLEHGYLSGDDTDGHIDTLARFCDHTTLCYMACDDPKDEHYPTLKAMEGELKDLRTLEDRPYHLVPLPWPQAKYDTVGQRLPVSYANFLIINGAVLVPTYADPADEEALSCLKGCFPGREIIGIPCLPLIAQYGSLHCVTMQLPAGVL